MSNHNMIVADFCPDGYRFVRIGRPLAGETFLIGGRKIVPAITDFKDGCFIILEKIWVPDLWLPKTGWLWQYYTGEWFISNHRPISNHNTWIASPKSNRIQIKELMGIYGCTFNPPSSRTIIDLSAPERLV